MAHHQDHHGAEANAKPVHERHQVAPEKDLGIHEPEGNRDGGGHDADIERTTADEPDDRRRREVEMRRVGAHFDSSGPAVGGLTRGNVAPVPGVRNSGAGDGTGCPAASATVACWLNCKARMWATTPHRPRGGIYT